MKKLPFEDEKFGKRKEDLIVSMSEKNIDCRPFFYPLSFLPAYHSSRQANKARQENKIAYKISPYDINLPCGMNIIKEKVRYVCDVLKSILRIAS